jgi:stearoyl-CoA desaturase (delta-9 desaturase)
MYIRILQFLGLAKVKHGVPIPRFVAHRREVDLSMLRAIGVHRYQVLAAYARSMNRLGARDERSARTMDMMRAELSTMWDRSTAPADQLVGRLREWCRRAESSGVVPLVEFSRSLRSYA